MNGIRDGILLGGRCQPATAVEGAWTAPEATEPTSDVSYFTTMARVLPAGEIPSSTISCRTYEPASLKVAVVTGT